MATNFSPCKGSYVLNQFPSNAMFGMNGFHISASGAIQGHHGPLVFYLQVISKKLPSDQLRQFVDLIQEGLVDPQSHSSSGACVVLNGIMKNRGQELMKEV